MREEWTGHEGGRSRLMSALGSIIGTLGHRQRKVRVSCMYGTGVFLPNGARPLLTSVLFLVLVSAHYSLSLTLQDQDKGPVENKAFKCVVRFQTCLV